MRNVIVGLLTFLVVSTAWGQEKLDLSGPGTTDDVLAEKVKGLTNLASLDLKNTRVTDAGLVHLEGLRKLEELNFAWHKTSSYKGIGTSRLVHAMILKKALPSCVIQRSPYDMAR
ncbi:MAG: hypothetical protein QF752_08345 [Planctomycetota bacterium]|jgi:hypothetical protein|nr:hypothetical protein [Planctomycetota bacterium]